MDNDVEKVAEILESEIQTNVNPELVNNGGLSFLDRKLDDFYVGNLVKSDNAFKNTGIGNVNSST